MKVQPELVDVLFRGLDALEGYLANILESADEGTEDNEDIINTLNSIADKAKGGTGEVSAPTPTAAPSADKSAASDGNKAKYENIRISDYEKATFDKAKENYKLEIDVKEVKKQVASLRNIISNIGEVNTGSIEEYERVSERYEFLNKQRDDLVNAENVLLEIIDEMDNIMNEKFTTTFKEINEEFKLVFRQLFNGGDANLKLSDETNILETGIEISACPAGKNLKSISLLSGGEKTLTAISLLFAILRVIPVPFCILDEVEAALDEVNVDNFGRYLSIFRNKTQFIVITHKKKTMEYADCLYGITMQESGVSKLVSVKLEDVKA